VEIEKIMEKIGKRGKDKVRWYWLTPEGKEIAKHLIEIEKIMEKMEKKKEGR